MLKLCYFCINFDDCPEIRESFESNIPFLSVDCEDWQPDPDMPQAKTAESGVKTA